MIVPGELFTGTQITVTRGLGTTATQILQGFGFMNDGSLALDTTAVPATPASITKGVAQNASGAAYSTTAQNASDSWIEGVRVSAAGALVVEVAAAAGFSNGNPITAGGNLAVSV
jgi:hypothetical protein